MRPRGAPGLHQAGAVLAGPASPSGTRPLQPRPSAGRPQRRLCRALAGRQTAVAVPPPPPPPPAPDAGKLRPNWVTGAGAAALAAMAALTWSWRSKRQAAMPAPAYVQDTAPPLPAPLAPAAPAATVATPPAPAAGPAEAQQPADAAAAPAVEAARAAVQEAGKHLAAANGAGAQQAAEAVGPLVLAAETGGAVDETASMSLEQLQTMATELYMLIQQMEMQLQELVAELSARLPEAALAELDDLAAAVEEVEERLALLKGAEGAEEQVAAAERQFTDLQWRQFDVVSRGAPDTDRRAYRSLLHNLLMQRALLRQVEAQEGIKLRIREVERSIEALLDDEPQRAQQARRPQSITPPEAVAAQQAAPASAAAAAVLGRPGRAAAGELHLVAAGASIPHPLKAATGGEDAYLVSGWGRGAVAVADGVGGWAAEGVDPALYPRRLMAACEEALAAGAGAAPEAEPGAAALAVLEAAHARTDEPGSCTAVVGLLQPGGRLSVANLGDTSLRLVRGGRVVHSTKVLEHTFNMPLQLSSPAFYDCGSRPADAHLESVAVQEGDVVVLGSDGLFDNLWDDQIVEAVAAEQVAGAASAAEFAQALAARLAGAAHRQSLDPAFPSPFAAELQERAAVDMGVMEPRAGGKPDDATAVVALVARA